MRVLVYGAKGWIGSQFVNLLKNEKIDYIIGTSRAYKIEDVKEELDSTNPTHIISLIGRTHGQIGDKQFTTIDYLEQPGKLSENVRDNLFSPMVLAFLAQERNIHLTYLGTGCIFKYNDQHPFGQEKNGFNESDLPNFTGSGYSTVKGFTDQLMKFFETNVLNLRIRMPIDDIPNPRNFITKITSYEKICSIPNSMSVLPSLLPKALDLMSRHVTGTLNFTNPGLISHNEILDMYKEIVDPFFEYKNFSEKELLEVVACDRSNNFLNTNKLQELCPDILSIKEAVKYSLENYKKLYKPIHPEIKKIKTLLITGGAGFIGSHFINSFCQKYPEIQIINLDALYYSGNKTNIDKKIRNSKNYKFIHGNLQSYELLKYIFINHEITHVIHFAAQSHVDNSFTDSLQYTKDNILGTHNLLEICRLHCTKLVKFIHVSTDEVYGESMILTNEKHKTEQSVLCPTNPYAATKAGAELIAQSFHHSFNMPIIITRGNNVYGPNQYPEKLIPKFIGLLKENKKVTIQGDGSCVRAFLYSSDTANAFETILFNGKIGEIYNIGCDDHMEYSVLDVAKLLIKKIKKTDDYDQWIEYVEDRPFNDKRYYISNQKLKDLGWNVTIDFNDGLDQLISSYPIHSSK